jgi:hypothetical protein
MILMSDSKPTLDVQRTVPLQQEIDPRRSEDSKYLDAWRDHVNKILKCLREGQVMALNGDFASLGRELDRLSKLKKGWDGYEAEAPSEVVVEDAREILQMLQ